VTVPVVVAEDCTPMEHFVEWKHEVSDLDGHSSRTRPQLGALGNE